MSEPVWKATNRAHWDEKVALHLGPRGYDLTSLRAGHGRFNAIEEAELWPVAGSRILHLQCHFGADSLKLAQRGATVVGLDFSAPAIEAMRCAVASPCSSRCPNATPAPQRTAASSCASASISAM